MIIFFTEISLFASLAFAEDGALYFYLVRHGQTYSNIKEMTIGGGGNAQLTAKGRYDARSLGEGLKDISWGNAEGGRIDDLTTMYGHSGNDFAFYFGSYTNKNFESPVKTENMYNFSQRFDNALRAIANEHQHESGNILVVSHSSMAFYLQKYRPQLPLSGLSNTSVSILKYKDGNFELVDFNNTDYLKKGYALAESLKPLEFKIIINPNTILSDVGVMEGTTDSDLNTTGINVSKKIAEKLKGSSFISAYSSTLGRAHETNALVLKESHVPVIYDENFNEIFLGNWEAEKILTIKEDKTKESMNLFSSKNVIKFKSPYGGENGDIASYRLLSALQKIGLKYEFSQGKVLVFTHPIIFRAFLNKVIPDYDLDYTNNAQMITLHYKKEVFSVADIVDFTN